MVACTACPATGACAPRAGTLGAFEAAEVALRILQSLAQLQPAVDGQGSPLQPLPAVHRALASPQCLPHIAQVRLLSTSHPFGVLTEPHS